MKLCSFVVSALAALPKGNAMMHRSNSSTVSGPNVLPSLRQLHQANLGRNLGATN